MSPLHRTFGFMFAVIVLSQATLATATETITLPFRAKGVVVSQSPGPDGTIKIQAEGQATHLGSYTAHITLMIFPGEPPTFAGIVTMFAANGDELHLVNFGIVTEPPPIPGGEGGYEIIGGTGRFTNATGQGAFSSHAGVTHFSGTITISCDN